MPTVGEDPPERDARDLEDEVDRLLAETRAVNARSEEVLASATACVEDLRAGRFRRARIWVLSNGQTLALDTSAEEEENDAATDATSSERPA